MQELEIFNFNLKNLKGFKPLLFLNPVGESFDDGGDPTGGLLSPVKLLFNVFNRRFSVQSGNG